MELYQLLEQVDSRDSFFKFLKALEEDKRNEDENEKTRSPNPFSTGVNGWENGTIVSFLESMHAGGVSHNFSEEPSWHTFAVILFLGKIYE